MSTPQTPTRGAHRHTTRRSTQRRSLIESTLRRSNSPLSAQDVHVALRIDGEDIGLSTVYRQLRAMSLDGSVRTIHTDRETVYCRLEADLLICDACGQMEAVDVPIRHSIGADSAGFSAERTPVAVHGTCVRCAIDRRATT